MLTRIGALPLRPQFAIGLKDRLVHAQGGNLVHSIKTAIISAKICKLVNPEFNIMPQSLAKVNVHIVFTTKYGIEFITDEIRPELHAYVIGTLSELGSFTYELYANPDHIHILCTLPRTITMADLVSKIKTSSSKWIKTRGIDNFYWQDGYGIFSVSPSKIVAVEKYIINQPFHHKEADYKDEFRLFLKENGIEYDERYVWD